MSPRLVAAGAGAWANESAPAATRQATSNAIHRGEPGHANRLVTGVLSVRDDSAFTRTGEHLCEDVDRLRSGHAEAMVDHEERYTVGAERVRLARVVGDGRGVGVAP